MSLVLELPKEYGYVLAAASSSILVNYVHFYLTAKYRRASGVKYPRSYATEEEASKNPVAFKFNCAQRAHTNFTEQHTTFIIALTIAGLRNPVSAGIAGGIWTLGRTIYALGYTHNGPEARVPGGLVALVADLFLKGSALYTSAKFLLGQ